MASKELQRACLCLNITFTVIPDDVLSSSELDLARSLFNESVPKLLVVGRLTSIDVKHPTLTSRFEQQGWTLHTCNCCVMAVFVADGASRAAVDGACKRESEFASVMASSSFSKTFGIAIPHKSAGAAAWHSIDDVSGCPQELLALATEKISNEKLAVDQRIKAYAYQQREQFEAFRQDTLVELEALSAAAVKVPEEKPPVLPFIRAGSPAIISRTSPFNLTPPRGGSPTTPLISSARSHSLILDRRPSINSSYPSRDSVSGLESPQAADFSEVPAGDDSIFEFEEDVSASSKGYYLSASSFQDWEGQHVESDEEIMSGRETRIPPLGGRSEGFAIASSLPISIPQSFKFTPHGNSVTNRGMMCSSSSSSSSSGNNEAKSGSGGRRGSLLSGPMIGRLQPRQETTDDEDERVVNMLLPPHTALEGSLRGRKGSEKDAEEQFEHAVRFQSLSLKTRTYL